MPIPAFAAATRRSAAAMSGRRSSSVEATPSGIAGTCGRRGGRALPAPPFGRGEGGAAREQRRGNAERDRRDLRQRRVRRDPDRIRRLADEARDRVLAKRATGGEGGPLRLG